jgi:hypothetical protein
MDPTPAPTPPPGMLMADQSGPRGIIAAPPPPLAPQYYAPPAPAPAAPPQRLWPWLLLGALVVVTTAFAVFVLLNGVPW